MLNLRQKLAIAVVGSILISQKSHSGTLEGVLIGAGIGAAVGVLVVQLTVESLDSSDYIDKNKIDSSFIFDTNFKYQIINDDSTTKKIRYCYPKLIQGYEKYANIKSNDADTGTNVFRVYADISGSCRENRVKFEAT